MTRTAIAVRALLSLVVIAITLAVARADDSAHDKAATFEELDYTVSASISGCGLCQQTGYCDQAFRGNPGQFCLTLFSGQPCCCPRNAQCVFNNQYACRCRRAMPPPAPHVRVVTRSTTTTTTSSGDSSKFSTLLIVLILLLCGCCCFCAAREKEREYCEPVYVAAPATTYGATETSQPQYGYAYPSAPPYVPDSNQSNSLAAGAAGGVAGLAAGLAIGSMFGGGGRNQGDTTTTTTTTTSYFGGDSGFAPTSYEFAGDTGGGDYGGDYGGDSGGDFAGDS